MTRICYCKKQPSSCVCAQSHVDVLAIHLGRLSNATSNPAGLDGVVGMLEALV
jgi:hypothetical protein